MGVSEIYGVNSSDSGDDEPREAAENSASDVACDPNEGIEAHPVPESASSEPQQISAISSASPPTQSAVEEIERLMASGAHPVDAAAPFLTGTTHAFDAAPSVEDADPTDEVPERQGWLRRFLGGSGRDDQPATEPAPDSAPDDGEHSDGDEARERTPGRSFQLPVRPAHAVVGSVFAVAVLAAALLLGRSASTDPTVPAAPMAASPAPAANPQLDRSQPIAVQKGSVDALCSPGSTDPFEAFSHEDGAAWKCLAPYNGVGQVLTVTLPDGPYVITEVRMMPGYDAADKDGSDLWVKHRVVSRATWRFDDGMRVSQEFDGSRRQQTVPVPEAVTNTVTLTIQKTDAPAHGTPPISASASAPPIPGSGSIPEWLGDSNWLPTAPPGAGGATPDSSSDEPQAFAISSIEIVGYPVRTNSAS